MALSRTGSFSGRIFCGKPVSTLGSSPRAGFSQNALTDPLVRLRLRGAARRLRQRAQDAAPRQLDLEVVVAEAARISQHGFGRVQEALPRCRRSVELRFGFTVAPGLVGYSAEREARLLDRAALDIEANCNRYEGERI